MIKPNGARDTVSRSFIDAKHQDIKSWLTCQAVLSEGVQIF